MLGHEFFHEQAHLELRHEFKRRLFLAAICLLGFLLYRFFCHRQEFEADRVAARKCGKGASIESLRFLQIREGKTGFLTSLISLHPKTERRVRKIFLHYHYAI
jgi:Zn-dependent protease with chaperone function